MATYLATVQIGRYDDARSARAGAQLPPCRRLRKVAARDFGRQPEMHDDA